MSEKRIHSDPLAKPAGLGAKRAKAGDADGDCNGESPRGLYFELPADATQLDELRAMYDTAESVSDDPSRSLPLLRGIIHECDLAVRMHHQSDSPQGDPSMSLDCPFWTLYGDALLLLGQVEGDVDGDGEEGAMNRETDVSEFVREAIHRYEQALVCDPKDPLAIVKRAIAGAMLFALGVDEPLRDNHLGVAFEQTDHLALLIDGLVEAAKAIEDNDRMIELLGTVKQHIQVPINFSASLSVLRCANMLTEARLEKLVGGDSDGCDDGDDDGCDDGDDVKKKEELIGIDEYLSKCIDDCAQVDEDERCIPCGEACLLRGSIMELLAKDEDAEVHYKRATEYFERAREANVELSEGIMDFLNK